MIKKKFQKIGQKFHCEICDYSSERKSQFERHCDTIKHKRLTMIKNDNKKVPKCFTCNCGKIYKYQSGISRHKKICSKINENILENIENKNDEKNEKNENIPDMFKTIINENKKLQNQIITMQNEHNQTLQSLIPKIGNGNTTNSHNNIINVQMFLNENCADAMSIQNFAKQLCVTMDDLTKNKMDCLTNVVLKNLRPLSLTERPFHCTNVNTKAWFVKDENQGWEEDNGEKLIKNAEIGIQKKWLNEFESQYPNWMSNDTQKDKYVQIAGSASSELPEKIKLKILRELSAEVPLSKDIISC